MHPHQHHGTWNDPGQPPEHLLLRLNEPKRRLGRSELLQALGLRPGLGILLLSSLHRGLVTPPPAVAFQLRLTLLFP
jgi:hypothetical protein